MIGTTITVKNKLEILPGGVVNIPSCEPTTSLTANALSVELARLCKASQMPYKQVLEVIPGSRIVQVMTPRGQTGTGLFIELPDGPPPDGNVCPRGCAPDWYSILRCHAKATPGQSCGCVKSEPQSCVGFDFSGCYSELEQTLGPGPEIYKNNLDRQVFNPNIR